MYETENFWLFRPQEKCNAARLGPRSKSSHGPSRSEPREKSILQTKLGPSVSKKNRAGTICILTLNSQKINSKNFVNLGDKVAIYYI